MTSNSASKFPPIARRFSHETCHGNRNHRQWGADLIWRYLAAPRDSSVPRHIRCFCSHYYWDPYSTAHAALEDVWEVITLGGEQSVAGIRLEYGDGSGGTKVLAEGAGLIRLAALTHLRQN